jgi:hypothetical protein
MARVRIGTIGWLFKSWDRDYYPEDIPQEWKLGYYANDMTAVVVPESFWQQADKEQLEQMAEDVHDDFGFYFQIEKTWPSVDEYERIESIFAANFCGFLVENESMQPPLAGNNRRFIFPASNYPGTGCSWSVLGQAGSTDCVIRVTAETQLRQLKQQFAGLAQTLDFSGDILVLIDLSDPRPDFIKQLRTMLELMMIA